MTSVIDVLDFMRLTDCGFGDVGAYQVTKAGVTANIDILRLANFSDDEQDVLLKFQREAKQPGETLWVHFI